LSVEDYRRLTGAQASIVDLLAMPDGVEIEFEPPCLRGPLFRPADLT